MHGGTTQSPQDCDELMAECELLGSLYAMATRSALSRVGRAGDLADRLGRIAGEYGSGEDPELVADVARRFHQTIVDEALSPQIQTVIELMRGVIPADLMDLPEAIHVTRTGLSAIVIAVGRGDQHASSVAYETLLRRQGELAVEIWRRRGDGNQTKDPL